MGWWKRVCETEQKPPHEPPAPQPAAKEAPRTRLRIEALEERVQVGFIGGAG